MKATSLVACVLIGGGTLVSGPQGCDCIQEVGRVPVGPTMAVAASEDLALFGVGSHLMVADLSDPVAPRVLAQSGFEGTVNDIELVGDTAYVASDRDLSAVDLSSPAGPVLTGSVETGKRVFGVAVAGDFVFMADGDGGVKVVRNVDPWRVTRWHQLPGSTESLAVLGNALLAATTSGLFVLDVSEPNAPMEVGVFDYISYEVVIVDGLAYLAHGDGLVIFDLSNPLEPEELGALFVPGIVLGVAVSGELAVLATDENGIILVDVSEPSDPVLIGELDTPGSARRVALAEEVALVADGEGGLRIVDVGSPEALLELATYRPAGSYLGFDLVVEGGLAYVAVADAVERRVGLVVVDVSLPEAPFQVGAVESWWYANDVAVSSSHAYLAADADGLAVVDVSDPHDLVQVEVFDIAGIAYGVAAADNHVFVAGGQQGLVVFDVSSPASPVQVGEVVTPGEAWEVKVSEGHAYVADGAGGLQVVDVSDPSNPVISGSFASPAGSAVAVDGDVVYFCGEGFFAVDVTQPSNPVELGSLPGVICFDIAVDEGIAYLARLDTLITVDVSQPSSPEILDESSIFAAGVVADNPLLFLAGAFEDGGFSVATVAHCPHNQPSIRIVSPEDGAEVLNHAEVTVEVENFELDCENIGGANVAGRGHWQLWVGNVLDSEVCTETATISRWLDQGRHMISALLVNNDGTPLDPPLGDSVRVTVGMKRQAVAAAASISGAGGTSWVTDLVLHNPRETDTEARLRFFERGMDNSDVGEVQLTVPAGGSVRLPDVLGETFGLAEVAGAVQVDSNAALLVSSRTYNDSETGTYGQYIPGRSGTQWIKGREEVALLQLTSNSSFRTNLGFTNLTRRRLDLALELRAEDGHTFATRTVRVQPYSHGQLSDISSMTGDRDDAYVVVSAAAADARYLVYASVVDRGSGDPTFIAPVADSDEALYIPAAAHVSGAAGTNWRTDLELLNTATVQARYRLELLEAETDNSEPVSVNFTLDAAACVRYEDVLVEVFGVAGSAALRIAVEEGRLMATSRTFNEPCVSTYGQGIPGFPEADAIGRGEEARLIQLAHSPDPESGFRTNIGVASASGSAIAVRVDLHSGDGTLLGTRSYSLEPYGFLQRNNVFADVSAEAVDDAFAVVRSWTPGARYFAYASVVDNQSGDPVFIPALPVEGR